MKETIIKSLFRSLHWVVATPMRALTFITLATCLAVLFIVMTILYDQRSPIGISIVNAIGEDRFVAKLDDTKFHEEITHLIRRSKAAGATVWAVNLAKPSRQIVYSSGENGTKDRDSLIGYKSPLYGGDLQNILALVKTQENKVACTDLRPETAYGEFLTKNKVTHICAISAPPTFGQFAGLITLEFYSAKDVPKLVENYLNFAAKQIVKY